MGSFGERLQREREMRGITLEEIAEATKIGTRSLRALEEQDFDKLPGGIFNKGFVRAYSRYLGLDEEQAVADYQTALVEAQTAGKATRQEPTIASASTERILITEVEDEPIRLPLGLIAIVLLIAVVLFGGWRYYAKNGLPKLRHVRAAGQPMPHNAARASSISPQAVASSSTTVAATPPPPTESPAPPKPAVASAASALASSPLNGADPADGFVVRVKAKETSWISIVADGKPVMTGMLASSAEKSIHAQHSVVLKLGNAAGLELFHNNQLVPPLGSAGQVKTVEFTSAGVRH